MVSIIVTIAVLASIAFFVMRTAAGKQLFSSIEGKGKAFVRVAEQDLAFLETQGKISALKAAEAVADKTLAELAEATAAIHAGRDRIEAEHARIVASL